MPLANTPLNDITEADLQELIDNQVAEGKEVDYKLTVGNSDDDKREFLADASSFANTVGGHLIIGMNEADGVPTGIAGLSINIDAEKLRIEEILRNGIAPRMRFDIQSVDVQTGKVLVIRVPRSWSAPHMVTFKNNSRFFARNSAGKYQLDVSELRSAFTLSETVTERIRNFRLDRVAKIAADETPIKLSAGAKLVLHLIPIGAFASANSYDTSLLLENIYRWTTSFNHMNKANDYRHNLDGLVFYYADSRREILDTSYIQFFRNGVVEFADSWILHKQKIIPSRSFEQSLLELLPIFCEMQEKMGVQPPIFSMLTLLGVRGYEMGLSLSNQNRDRDTSYSARTIDRDDLIIPDFLIENFGINYSQTLRQAVDAVWNSCGYPRSLNYDKDGNWKPVE